MKERILEIAEKLRLELITEYEAETLLLSLFSVSWRSEQLKTFLSKLVEEFDNGEVSWNTRDDAENMIKSF
jgi:hypothetical protein